MSAVAASKPVVGRGRGRGWLGNFKPKPCNLRTEDIVSLPQSYSNVADEKVNHVQKPPLSSQSSVEDLSEKIARGILGTQVDENIKEILVVDLTNDSENSELNSTNTSNPESWIESVESLEFEEQAVPVNPIPTDEKSARNEHYINEQLNSETKPDNEYSSINKIDNKHNQVKNGTHNDKLNIVFDEKKLSTSELDEKPKDLCDYLDKLNLSDSDTSSIIDELNLSSKNSSEHTNILIKAVSAKEFVPTWHIPSDEKENNTELLQYHPQDEQCFNQGDEEEIVLNVLNDIILALQENPGDFDFCIEQLTEHLVNFVTQETTLKKVVDTIIGQAIALPNFGFIAGRLSQHLDERKTLELENGVTFRKVFFKRCQDEFKVAKELCKDADSCKENKDKIYRTCILFGELLCTMKIKGTVNKVYKIAVSQFIDIFLNIGIEENIVTLTKLLKLVGPELDKDRPKDIEALFDKVKDFYLDGSRSGNLQKDVRKALWDVYKLHSRDWDRSSSPVSPLSTDKEFFALPEHPSIKRHLERQVSSESSRSCNSPVDWEEFYGGDDADLYKNYMDMNTIADDEFDAYEEFLRISGQLDPSD